MRMKMASMIIARTKSTTASAAATGHCPDPAYWENSICQHRFVPPPMSRPWRNRRRGD